ncbi:BnaA01g30400D [Brassica napus]|uniref:BnaA01g30400D protein n=1 Tax=Brassica napus TaxID=3708 RepID=A0A078IHU3_BRANA|nr:unnamed protein product [Brassica napus]CDY50540.1 BnaA01g30400D [Brassica napus]
MLSLEGYPRTNSIYQKTVAGCVLYYMKTRTYTSRGQRVSLTILLQVR